ncbi:MAG TPA: GxxExxY protein [Caulobacteraceae bacterium]|nr:GxxExxY protein [Caulobacteraceae bacterium]
MTDNSGEAKRLNHPGLGEDIERVGRIVVDAGLKVHRALGPGLLESAYEHCLGFELNARGVSVRRQAVLPILYEGSKLDAGYRLDLLVEEKVIVEIKAIDALTRVHEAQVLTYLKLSGCRLGFLMNFNVELFKRGLKRLTY